jgi:Rnl2 family RNA ligase
MTEFKKYSSMENTYQNKFIRGFLQEYPELLKVEYEITEKIHGSNLNITFMPNEPWRYGKRTSYLAEDAKFFGYQEVAAQEQYQQVFRTIQQWMDDGKTGSPFRLFGELFGPGINKGIDYGPEKQIRFYDIMEAGQLSPPCEFRIIAFKGGFQHLLVPRVGLVRGLQAALDFDTEFPTLINPKEGNLCEGVVIKPYDGVYYDKRGKWFCLKKKNEKFMEKAKSPKPSRSEDPELTRLNLAFREYLTDARLQSVFSKEGEIEEPPQIGGYIRLVLADAKEDFIKDHDISHLGKKEQRQVFNVGSLIAIKLKEYL